MIYIQLLQSMSLIALSAYIFNQIVFYKKSFSNNSISYKLILIIFFTIVSILGTYTGVEINHAIANTRPIGAITAGYVGGPFVGVVVGLISGFQRHSIGGFTALACGISTVVEGLCGGLAKVLSKKKELDPKLGFFTALIAELLQMFIILLITRPFDQALELEKIIALPMILINSIGVVIFINITNNAIDQYNKIGALQAEKALLIAEKTLNYLKQGFNEETSQKIARIIYESNNYKGVFIGNLEGILASYGNTLSTDVLKSVLQRYYISREYKGIFLIENYKEEIFFCIPIYETEKLEMVVGLHMKAEKHMDEYFIQFTKQLSKLLSTQLRMYNLNKAVEQAYLAEYKALRAQIHPHFLFNALNTIASFCRTNPLRAKELIINLSNYFRRTLKREEEFLTLREELDFLNSYLSIENARFGTRLQVNINIPEELMECMVPVFILQPLIENSIKHGILLRPSGGNIDVIVKCVEDKLYFSVEDDGVGMDEDVLKNIFNNPGIGLNNVNERLRLLYGNDSKLNIESAHHIGTKICFFIPKEVRI